MFRYKFEVEDEYGNVHISENKVELYPSQGVDEIDELERGMNKFMSQLTYPRFDKDRIILESVTDEEYEYLMGCLCDYREDKKG